MSIEKLRMELSRQLKEIRTHWNLTQKEMAGKMGIGLSTYQYYERAERDIPAVTLLALAEQTGSRLSRPKDPDDGFKTFSDAISIHPDSIRRLPKASARIEMVKKLDPILELIKEKAQDIADNLTDKDIEEIKEFVEFKLAKKAKP